MGGMEGIKRERSEQQSDRAENHHQNELDLGRFEVQEVMFLIKNAWCLYLELCFLCRRGVHFQKIHEKKWSESEKWGRETLDGKCDGYRWGLGGAENGKCWFFIGFNSVF